MDTIPVRCARSNVVFVGAAISACGVWGEGARKVLKLMARKAEINKNKNPQQFMRFWRRRITIKVAKTIAKSAINKANGLG